MMQIKFDVNDFDELIILGDIEDVYEPLCAPKQLSIAVDKERSLTFYKMYGHVLNIPVSIYYSVNEAELQQMKDINWKTLFDFVIKLSDTRIVVNTSWFCYTKVYTKVCLNKAETAFRG